MIDRRHFVFGLLGAAAAAVWKADGLFVSDVRAGTGARRRGLPEIRPTQRAPRTGYDLVILGGRVMDPETGFDAVANVGVRRGRIVAITGDPIEASKSVDARGLVVAPGFIDPLSYQPNGYGEWFKIADGVTTVFGGHGVDFTSREFFEAMEGLVVPVNHGGAFDHPKERGKIGLASYDEATAAQAARLGQLAEQQILAGWGAIDLEPEYQPGTTREEVSALGRVAAKHGVPMFFHVRYSDPDPPGTNREAIDEVLAVARETGASVHVEHINSTGGTFEMETILRVLERARRQGIDVTACMYPYTYWSTFLASARFDGNWRKRFRIGYSDLELPATGERLTTSTFERYQRENAVVAAHAIPEADVIAALRSPLVMIGSDGMLVKGQGRHPRAAGTFSRVLGRYVRELKVITLMEALAKMTIMPAQRLERAVPGFRRKGRIQNGMDADITIFDPNTVSDRATVAEPDRQSVGIDWVVVKGHVVRSPNGINTKKDVGRPLKYDPDAAPLPKPPDPVAGGTPVRLSPVA